jgi:hypothetical protein
MNTYENTAQVWILKGLHCEFSEITFICAFVATQRKNASRDALLGQTLQGKLALRYGVIFLVRIVNEWLLFVKVKS